MQIVNGKEVLDDQEKVNVRMQMMDSKGNVIPSVMQQHKPGFVTDGQQKDVSHYGAYEKDLTTRWKNPPSLPQHLNQPAQLGKKDAVADPTQQSKNAMYASYDDRVRNAWRKENEAHARGVRAAGVGQ